MSRSAKRVWFLVAPNTGLLNLGGPWDVLGYANELLGRRAYETELVGPGGPSLPTRHGIVVSGVRPLPRTAGRLPDIVIVAGGSPRTPLPDGQARIVKWLRRYHARIPTIVS